MGHLTTFLERLPQTVHEKSPHLKPAALAILRKLCRGGQLSRAMPSGRRRIMREGVQQKVQEASRATNRFLHFHSATIYTNKTKARKKLSCDLPQGWEHPSVSLTPTVYRTLCPVSL